MMLRYMQIDSFNLLVTPVITIMDTLAMTIILHILITIIMSPKMKLNQSLCYRCSAFKNTAITSAKALNTHSHSIICKMI